MDTRLTTTHGPRVTSVWRPAAALLVAVVLAAMLGATSASAASPTACKVKNTDTGKSYKALQAGVDAARPGDRLTVKGVCHGGTLIGKSLVIEGIRTRRSGKPKLSGDGEVGVLWIKPRATVRLLALEILRGVGAGIVNRGKLVLRDVQVRRNVGNGISNGGKLTLNGTSAVVGNEWGGISNAGILTLNDDSRVSRNRGGYGGGIFNSYLLEDLNEGRWCGARPAQVTLNDASAVTDNNAEYGGGIHNRGILVMDGSSTVAGNTARVSHGGVYNSSCGALYAAYDVWGTVTLRGASSIVGNTAVTSPGGLGFGPSGTVTGVTCGPGGNVYCNTPDDCSRGLVTEVNFVGDIE